VRADDHKVSKITSEAIFAVRPISSTKFILAFLICALLILIDGRYETSKYVRGFAHDIIAPLYLIVEAPSRILRKMIELRKSNEDLKKELEEYKKRLNKLTLITSQIEDLTKRNQELQLLWESTKIDESAYLLGQKRHLSLNPMKPILVIEVEDPNSLIQTNQAVLSKQGIIGKITSLGINNIEVALSYHPEFLIPVISSKNRLHGILKGQGIGRKGSLINIKKTASFESGEKLYSSGLGELFPQNHLVGTISSIKESPDNDYLTIEVDLLDLPKGQEYFLVFTK
tara:strand:+ start:3527 stop:4381 length:855 start_codon:yes stop_codon:yes gene_type:complete